MPSQYVGPKMQLKSLSFRLIQCNIILSILNTLIVAISITNHPLLHSPNNTLLVPPGVRCYLPGPDAPLRGVNFRVCQAVMTRLLGYPGADRPERYYPTKERPAVISTAPCAIMLDRQQLYGAMWVSRQQIVGSVWKILMSCQPWGLGGWEIHGEEFVWLVAVDGDGNFARTFKK